MCSRGIGQADDVTLQHPGHVDFSRHQHHLGDAPRVGDRFDVVERRGHAVGRQDGRFGFLVRIADREPHHEPVQLRFGKRIGPFVLDRVLGGDDHERHAQVIRHTVHRDLVLFHAFQERRLCLGAGPVDLVSEHDVGEDRPRLELEVTAFLVVDVHPGDVGRKEVGRELDAAERAVDRASDGLRQHRLSDAGDVRDQQVAFGHQADQRQLDLLLFPLDDVIDVMGDRGKRRRESLPLR